MVAIDAPIDVLSALADPTRLHLLTVLSRGEQNASALSRDLPISRSAVLKHLGVLERCALVSRVRVGREMRYSVRPEPLQTTARWMAEIAHSWDTRLTALRRLAED